MKTVDRIIFDALAARRGVVLPDVGTLEVRRVAARRISDTQIVPPQNEVTFVHEWNAGTTGSLVAAIAARRGVNESEAATAYSEWLGGARRENGSVDLGAVGTIADGSFTPSAELLGALNPAGGEAVAMEADKRRSRAWVVVVAIVALALVALCIFRCCSDGAIQWGRKAATGAGVTGSATVAADASDAADAAREADTEIEASRKVADETKASLVGRYAGTDRFHVIIGAFAVESNADKYMVRLKREHPELTPVKLPQPGTGYNMVSILQAPTERQAVNRMNLYWDLDPGLWIYEQK